MGVETPRSNHRCGETFTCVTMPSRSSDGLNDAWFPVIRGEENITTILQVFSRWGHVVFETNIHGRVGWWQPRRWTWYRGLLRPKRRLLWRIAIRRKRGEIQKFSQATSRSFVDLSKKVRYALLATTLPQLPSWEQSPWPLPSAKIKEVARARCGKP